MKLGILGTGMIVKDLLQTFDRLTFEKIVLLSTRKSEDTAKELCEKYHLTGYTMNYKEMLKSDLDTIYVALPNSFHFSFAKEALEHDKNVIIEKPITANAKELQELIQIAEKKHKMILEAMNIHYLPAFQKLKEYVAKIGDIKIVSFNYSQYSSRYDAFKRGEILPAFDFHKAGGALMDLNVYNLHTLVGLFGEPLKASYQANVQKGIDTSGIMTLDYGSFKAVSIGAKDCKAPLTSTIQGDEGVLCIHTSMNQLKEFVYIDQQNESHIIEDTSTEHRLYFEFQEFIRIIEEKDWEKEQSMLKVSFEVSQMMENARKMAGIKFDNDK